MYVFSQVSSSDQGDFTVVPIHKERDPQADHEINRHGHGNHFNGLASLIENRAHKHRNQLRIGNGYRERRVLSEIQVLAGQWRDDDPKRLWDNNKAEGVSRFKAERVSRLNLAKLHGLHTGPNDLRNEGSR